MTHHCIPSARIGNTYSMWFARWIRDNDKWFMCKVCDKCISDPNYCPVILISIDNNAGPHGYVKHVLYHMYGDSPLGYIRNRYLSIETGLINANGWEVIGVSDLDDDEATQISRIVQGAVV